MKAREISLAICVTILACSCKQKEASKPMPTPSESKKASIEEVLEYAKNQPGMTPERLSGITSTALQLDADEKQSAKDRVELVLPAPADFKPKPKSHALKLTLFPEKAMIRTGEKFRYRMEIQNVGQEPVNIYEHDRSFVKGGSLNGQKLFSFFMSYKDEKELKMGWDHFGFRTIRADEEVRFPPGMTSAQKADHVARMDREDNAAAHLFITLQPGETLKTRGDSPSSPFRDLVMNSDFHYPGTYHIKVVYDDLEMKNSEKHALEIKLFKNREELIAYDVAHGHYKDRDAYLKDIEKEVREGVGHIESNTIDLEVVQ